MEPYGNRCLRNGPDRHLNCKRHYFITTLNCARFLMKFFYTLIFLFSFVSIFAQTSFPEKCLGIWAGTMHIYNRGSLVDSVPIKLNVIRTNAPDTFVWKTEYLSTKNPMVKDYKLVISDAGKGVFKTDKGDGTFLIDYLFENKLYSVFETQGILLTST